MKRLQLRRPRAIRSTGIACCRPATPPHLSLRVPSLARDSPRHAACRPERRLHHGTRMAEPGKSPREDSTVPPMPQPGGIAARARAAAGAPYLDDLNPEQRQAVETLDGPVLVLAGAGTGKTRVLTTRIAHILATGRARPSEILAVTFTNKAAREMKERVGTMVGQVVEGMPWLGTFHSIGVKILRRHAELVGPEARLHHPRRRRPDPPAQAAAGGRGHRREALAGARARRPDRQLEEPRPHARPGARRRGRELRRRQAARSSTPPIRSG